MPSLTLSGAAPTDTAMQLTLLNRCVWAEVSVDDGEVLRRASHGIGAVTSVRLLEALSTLPTHETVRWSSLQPYHQAALRQAPDGCITREGRHVVRHIVAPLMVHAVVLDARQIDHGIDAASRFAPYCQRALVVNPSRVTEVQRLNASLFGVGMIATSSGSGLRTIVEPAPFKPHRRTWGWWRFQELAWSQLSVPASLLAAGGADYLMEPA